MANIIGRKLDGRYEIQEIIGIGGMAIVYKAFDSIDDRTVAVKVLKEEYLTNEDFKRRFKNESKAIAVLSHPNIVKVYDVSLGEKIQYIVMEYIDGITLKEYIDQQRILTWKEAVHFTVQILRALQHAHEKGIVHRDIKPQNIMMLEDGTIKVADFGIARFANSETRTMTDKAIGSVHYISPEQARGAETDEKSDIYSVGVMLYEMLTGELPFESENAVSVAIMQMQQEPRRPRAINDKIPEGLEDITLRAMQKEPAQRYQSASDMLADIDEFKKNPSIHFEYKYFVDESPTKYVDAINKIKGTQVQENPKLRKKREPENSPKNEKQKKASVIPILSAIAAAVLLIALGLTFWALKSFGAFGDTGSGNVKVPNVTGKLFSAVSADTSITKNFVVSKDNQQYDSSPAGTILKQDPDAGEMVKPHGQLKLTVSLGPQQAKVTDVGGMTASEAQVALKNDGFTTTLTQQTSADVAKGSVIKTDPAIGTAVAYGSNVTIYVSTGPENATIPNDLSGKKEADAKTELSALGLSTTSTYAYNSTVPAGCVISTNPGAGASVSAGSKVVLTVSNGPEPSSTAVLNNETFVIIKLAPSTNYNVTVSVNTKNDSEASGSYNSDNGTIRLVTANNYSGSNAFSIIISGTEPGSSTSSESVTYTYSGVANFNGSTITLDASKVFTRTASGT